MMRMITPHHELHNKSNYFHHHRRRISLCWVGMVFSICVVSFFSKRISSSSSSPQFSAQRRELALPPSQRRQQQQRRPRNMNCIGGSSGMGKAAAYECLYHGGSVLLISRSIDKLHLVKQQLIHDMSTSSSATATTRTRGSRKSTIDETEFDPNRIQIVSLDVTNESAVQEYTQS